MLCDRYLEHIHLAKVVFIPIEQQLPIFSSSCAPANHSLLSVCVTSGNMHIWLCVTGLVHLSCFSKFICVVTCGRISFFEGWKIFCTVVTTTFSLFIHLLTFRLFLPEGYCESYFNEHECTNISSQSSFSCFGCIQLWIFLHLYFLFFISWSILCLIISSKKLLFCVLGHSLKFFII